MGFLGGAGMAGAAGGANQALQNFLNFYMQNKELSQRKKLEEDRLAEQVRLRKVTEAHQTGMMGISQSREDRERQAAEDVAAQTLRERMAVQPMPQYPVVPQGMTGGPEAYPEMPGPKSFEQQLRDYTQVAPGAGLKMQAELQKRDQPRSVKVIYGPDNATKVIFVSEDTELPEGWSFAKQDKPKPRQLKGFDKQSGVSVYADPNTDALVYEDGTPYTKGQLKPITEPAQITVLNQSTDPASMEKLADAIEAGRTTMATVAKGMGGAHTAREVSIVLEGRGVDVASLEVNLAAKRSALLALEKTVNQLKPFEETARRNLHYAQSISKEYVRTRFPDINRLKQLWDMKTGDPLIEKFKVATYDGMMEAMKHMLAGSGITAAELSIGAQKKSEELMSTVKTWEQFDAIVEAIEVGLTNRANAYREQLQKLKGQSIVNFTPPPEIPATPQTTKPRFTIKQVR